MAKKKETKKPASKKGKKTPKAEKNFKPSEVPKEKEKLQARLAFLLDEAEDLWYGKRGEHSHINPIFKEYWRLVDIAKQLYKGNYIFDDLDISEATQPNADDIQALEMDIRKMLVVFEMDTAGTLARLLTRLNMSE